MIMMISHTYGIRWIKKEYVPKIGLHVVDKSDTIGDTSVARVEASLHDSEDNEITTVAWSKFPLVVAGCMDPFVKYWMYLLLLNKSFDYDKEGFCGGVKVIGCPPPS